MVSSAVGTDTAASAGGARQSLVDASRSVPGLLFPLLFGDLLQPEPGENPQIEKKQEGASQEANPTALVPVPVPPPPVGFVLVPIAGQISDAASGAEGHTSTDLEPVPRESAEFGANGMPDLEQVSNQGAAARPELEPAGPAGEALPAGFVREPIRAELTVLSAALPASVPATPVIPKAPTQEISELSASGIVPFQQAAPQASADSAPAAAPPRTPAVPNVADTGWISPALSAIAAFASEAASGGPAAPAPVTTGSKRAARLAVPSASCETADLPTQPAGKVELAFSARLSPLEKSSAPHLSVPAQGRYIGPLADGLMPSLQRAEMDANLAPRKAPAAGAMTTPRKTAHPGTDAAPDAELPIRNAESPALANAARPADLPLAASPARPEYVSPVPGPHRAAIATPPEPAPLWSAPAREIRLQVSGGEQRVDVRLTEHRGEVQVAVRTPDSRLTEALRSDLPALSARLEQNGFRAETWHPAASRPDHSLLAPEPSSSGSAPQGHGGERHSTSQDREPPSRRAPLPEDRSDAPPPEFSWFLSSLR